jgi:hypothetical protein
MKRYRPPGAGTTFKFPFRLGGRSQATGHFNAPPSGRPSKSMPTIKQFTKLGDPQRRKQKGK